MLPYPAMATYVIGDVHGCLDTLQALLERVRYDPARDRLWQVGDLINRGTRSLDTLRWAMGQGPRLTSVLGNHDIAILAGSRGFRAPKRTDTLFEVLDAEELPEILSWLRTRPLFVREGERAMVHAGILPGWSLQTVESLARDAHAALFGPTSDEVLSAMYQEELPERWDPRLQGPQRHAFVIQMLTRLRMCNGKGRPRIEFTGHPKQAPKRYRPWFDDLDPSFDEVRLYFGHWAALGLMVGDRVTGLDSGCVYGGSLTAVRTEDGRIFQQPLSRGQEGGQPT